jgi:hypothetical protein
MEVALLVAGDQGWLAVSAPEAALHDKAGELASEVQGPFIAADPGPARQALEPFLNESTRTVARLKKGGRED